jgi:hypothetical protein
MTEQEWLVSTDLKGMMGFAYDKASDRKKRLFVVACCRRIWSWLTDRRHQMAVEEVERFADGLANRREREAANEADSAAWMDVVVKVGGVYERAASCLAGSPWDVERAAHIAFVRDIFGNPLRPIAIDRSCLTPTMLSLAQAAYEHRDLPAGTLQPDRLAVLADALEEAGAGGEVVEHLQGPGPHVRGCHVIDLLLRKE